MKTVSIVIATRNRVKQLRPGLESIAAQNYTDVEVLVIDDGSDDETPHLLEEAKGWLSGLRVHRIARPGGWRLNPSATFNVGHRMAKGEIVLEQGGEVCHLTDCVTPLVEACRPGRMALARVYNGTPEEMRGLQARIDTGDYPFPEDFEPERCETRGELIKGPRLGEDKLLLYCGLERPAPFMFLGALHQDAFNAVGGYDEHLSRGNDEDLANRLQARGVKFCFVGKAVAFHLKHGKS